MSRAQRHRGHWSAALRRQMFWAQVVAVMAGICFTIPAEVAKVRTASETKAGLLAWIFLTNLDTTFPLLLFVILPLAWYVRCKRQEDVEIQPANRIAASHPVERTTSDTSRRVAWAMALAWALTSMAGSAGSPRLRSRSKKRNPPSPFGDLPPAIHDEFSYLFQAKTFLAGKISYPSSPRMPELFDQMHVLNEGRFASRYFPGVGLWLAPFVAIGHPHWGEFLAGALTAFFIFSAHASWREIGSAWRPAC